MQRRTVWDYRLLRVNWIRGRFQIFDCGNPAEGSLSIFRLVDLHKEIHFLKCLKTKWILALWNFQNFNFCWLPISLSHDKVDHVLNVRNHRPYRIFLVEILTRSSSIKKLRVFYKSDTCVVLFVLIWSQLGCNNKLVSTFSLTKLSCDSNNTNLKLDFSKSRKRPTVYWKIRPLENNMVSVLIRLRHRENVWDLSRTVIWVPYSALVR